MLRRLPILSGNSQHKCHKKKGNPPRLTKRNKCPLIRQIPKLPADVSSFSVKKMRVAADIRKDLHDS